MQSHSSLMRTIVRALKELTECGLVEHRGSSWVAAGAIVSESYKYPDPMQRMRQAVRFGTWLALVLILKITRIETSNAFRDAIQPNPIS